MEYPDDMSESDTASTAADLEALEALQADASGLERIEELLDRYNIFEAIGFTNQEIMHSRFLAFLLDPKRDHGLDDLFLRGLLRKCSESTDGYSLPRVEHHDGGLGQTTVHTEVYAGDGRIDILLLNEAGKWAMIVENKVWTTERSGQLEKYYQFVKENYPNHLVRGIYLTPHGDRPSHEEYLPLSYGAVCEILDSILAEPGSNPSSDVRMSLQHYTDMVRRNIVGDSEIARLCQRLYREHHKAFDLVFQHRFATQEMVRRTLINLIRQTPGLIHDGGWINYPAASYVDFAVEGWDVPGLQVGSLNDRGNRILEFVFGNYPENLILDLQIRPGDEATRRKLFDMAHAHSDVFNGEKDPSTKYSHIFRRTMLPPSFYEDDVRASEREQEIRRRWDEFLHKDLPRIEEALRKETWIWEPVRTDPV
jgi:PD-(D/E)XK nuclease superfamily